MLAPIEEFHLRMALAKFGHLPFRLIVEDAKSANPFVRGAARHSKVFLHDWQGILTVEPARGLKYEQRTVAIDLLPKN